MKEVPKVANTVENCEQCTHEFDPHVMVATGEKPTDGGIMICPVKGCFCYSTWDVPPFSSRESIIEPDRAELAQIYEQFQKEVL